MDTEVARTYREIAKHFDETRVAIWNCVNDFFTTIPKNSIMGDIGCGNGKYTKFRKDVFVIALDICLPLLELVGDGKHYDRLHANAMSLPIRTDTFDHVISIAVVHHIQSSNDRKKFLENIMNALKENGTLLFTVWAAEQKIKSKWIASTTTKNDYLIPWLDKNTGLTHQRYYHLFDEIEVKSLASSISKAIVKTIKYEKDNWCVVLEKII